MTVLANLSTIGGAVAGAFGGPIGVAAGAGLGALAQTMNERENVELQQKYYKENQKLALSQQHELNRTATPEAVQGMKDAGLSPASMNAPMAPASRPAAPMGAKAESVQTAQTLASLANVEADTKLKKSQAEQLDIKNNRDKSLDSSIGEAIIRQLNDQKNLYVKLGVDDSVIESIVDDINQIAENPDKYNLGDFLATIHAIEVQSKSLDVFTHRLEQYLKQDTYAKQINTSSNLEYKLLRSSLALQMANAYYLNQSGDLAASNLEKVAQEIKNLQEQVNLYRSQGKLTDAQAANIVNSDVHTMLENGEFLKVIAHEGLNSVEKFSQGLGQGAGFAGGTALVGGRNLPLSITKSSGLAKLAQKYPSPFHGKDAVTYGLLADRIGLDNAKAILGKFMASSERKRYNNDFTAWLGAYNRSNGRFPK